MGAFTIHNGNRLDFDLSFNFNIEFFTLTRFKIFTVITIIKNYIFIKRSWPKKAVLKKVLEPLKLFLVNVLSYLQIPGGIHCKLALFDF